MVESISIECNFIESIECNFIESIEHDFIDTSNIKKSTI